MDVGKHIAFWPTPDGTYTIEGKAGLNLIEVENYSAGNPPELSGTYKHFATRYRQRRSETNPPDTGEFYLQAVSGGWRLSSDGADLFLRYLMPTDYNHVSVRFELESRGNVAPTLKAYRLVNRIDRDVRDIIRRTQ